MFVCGVKLNQMEGKERGKRKKKVRKKRDALHALRSFGTKSIEGRNESIEQTKKNQKNLTDCLFS